MATVIESETIRTFWNVVEETRNGDLLDLTDTGLIRLLLQKISKRIALTGDDVCLLYGYISSKTALIRDIADSRLIREC
jgi:hypothetical protein